MRRRRMMLTGLCLSLIGGPALAQKAAANRSVADVYIGTHENNIFGARLDERSGRLTLLGPVADIERPTWLATDPKRAILYSVSETGNDGKSQGAVLSLAIDARSGKLTPISKVQSGGGGATYLTFAPRLNTVFVANYGGGQVAAVPTGPDGALQPVSSVQTDVGSGPSPRQKSAHAHGVVVDPSGRFVLAPDLGADRVFIYRYDAATRTLSPGDPSSEALPAGSGPRHLAFSPNGRFAYLATELSAEVRAFRWDARAGRLKPVQTLAIDKPDFKGDKSAAEIAVSADGRFVYVSNRGENQLQVYAIDRKTGTLTERQDIACGGDVPWSFGIDPSGRWMIVANETSSTLTEFRIDKASGRLSSTDQTLSVPKPVAIAFYLQ